MKNEILKKIVKPLKEIWEPILGYEKNYEVSNYGQVRSIDRKISNGYIDQLHRGKVLSQFTNEKGYKRVRIQQNGVPKSFRVHRLVVEAFIGAIPDTLQVNHIDGDPSNNRLNNLEVVTASENQIHAVEVLKTIKTRPVISLNRTTGQLRKYVSAGAAARRLNIRKNKIYECLYGRKPSYKDRLWFFQDVLDEIGFSGV